MKVYKLTNANAQTMGGMQWGEGVTHEASGTGKLCTEGWLHCYCDPILAVLFDPIHANFGNDALLWEAWGAGAMKNDNGLKMGFQRLTTIKQVALPVVTTEQRVRFAILCVMEVCYEREWRKWAEGWLSGKDRTQEAAWGAARGAAWAAARGAAWAAAWGAAWAAKAAAWAAEAAEAAAWVAQKKPLNLPALAKQAMTTSNNNEQ